MVDEIKKCIRIGVVHTVSEAEQTARVKYMLYGGMLSAELKVIYQEEKWMPEINDAVLCICPPDGDGDGYIIGRL